MAAPEEPKRRLIHFEPPERLPGGRVRPVREGRTYCGARTDQEPDTDTKIDKTTCKRCQQIRAKELRPKMRVVRVSYRAYFVGMKHGPLNPIGAIVRMPIGIEVYESTGGHWKFRAPHNGAEISELGDAVGLEQAKKIASEQFDKLADEYDGWAMIGDAGDGKGRRVLSSEEVVVKEGKVYVYEDVNEREAAKR